MPDGTRSEVIDPGAQSVTLGQERDVERWCARLRCTETQLQRAIKAVGEQPSANRGALAAEVRGKAALTAFARDYGAHGAVGRHVKAAMRDPGCTARVQRVDYAGILASRRPRRPGVAYPPTNSSAFDLTMIRRRFLQHGSPRSPPPRCLRSPHARRPATRS